MKQNLDKNGPEPSLNIRDMDLPLILLTILLVLITAATLFFANRHFREEIRISTLSDNTYLTAEWRLLREMKTRTDHLLAEKDREIADLRTRYETLKLRDSSKDVLLALEEKIRQAVAERADILSIRLSSAASSETAEDFNEQLEALFRDSFESASSRDGRVTGGESPVVRLLRDRIVELEMKIAEKNEDVKLLESEISSLRKTLDSVQESTETVLSGIPARELSQSDLEEIINLLESDRAALAELDPVFSVTDVKTRSLLRAITRTPAIRSEYPDLADSLDRYFELYGSSERIKGKMEAYDEIIAMLEEQRFP